MRNVVAGMLAVLLLAAVPALAVDAGGRIALRRELSDVQRQIEELGQKARMENPDVKKAIDAFFAAQTALEMAYGEIREIKALDQKRAALRKELSDLQWQEMYALEKALQTDAAKAAKKAMLDATAAFSKDKSSPEKRKALFDTTTAYDTALSNDPALKAAKANFDEAKKRQVKLASQRRALLTKYADNDAVKKATQDVADAQTAIDKAVAAVAGMKELLDKKADIEKRLNATPIG